MADDQHDDDVAAQFEARIDESVQRYRDEPGIDFAQASLAEALAWCLARLENSSSPEAAQDCRGKIS